MRRPSRKWRALAAVYRRFAKDSGLDLSLNAAREMYIYESTGKGKLQQGLFEGGNNGYAYGKRRMDLHISMYKEDIKAGLLFPMELVPHFPIWWIKTYVYKTASLNAFRRFYHGN